LPDSFQGAGGVVGEADAEALGEGEGVAVGVDVFVDEDVKVEVIVGGVVPPGVFVLVTCGVIVGLLGTHSFEPV